MSYTLYDILEVSSRASPEIVRSAYRTLVNQYHPDKNAREGSDAVMAEINRAYAILSDPVTRKAYDASLVTRDSEEREQRRADARREGPFHQSRRRSRQRTAEEDTSTQQPDDIAQGESSERQTADAQSANQQWTQHEANDPGWNRTQPVVQPWTLKQSRRKQWILV